MKSSYQHIINNFNNSKVLVIGDVILDAYLKGDSTRLSPEAPVPVVNVLTKEEAVGGAANIALNLCALGADVTFLSAVGSDEEGQRAIDILSGKGIGTDYIVKEEGRRTTVKTRVMAKAQILARFDQGTQHPILLDTQMKLEKVLLERYDDFDAVVIGDYYQGILTPYIVSVLQKLQEVSQKLLSVDSKELTAFAKLRPTLVKPNYFEAMKLAGLDFIPSNRVRQAETTGKILHEKTGAEIIALSLDAEGALIFEDGDLSYRADAYNVPAPNVVGAGDTFISAFTLSLINSADIGSATELAIAAATVAIQKEDTAPCYNSELKAFFTSNSKLVSDAAELQQITEVYRSQGKKVVFTNGCFDILHSGHVSYLNRSKELGDVLIVALNCDESVQRLKGPDRPINPLDDRIEVLSGLSAIDHVVSFGHQNEDSPVELIKAARPDIYAKGGDYTKETLPEASLVEELGGKIEFVSFVPDHSTTRIIHRINNGGQLKQPA
ncbi:D-glycero-beta-D-manno-heptose 1-phosphate adenylyltransferase [Desertivirga brevis]|uniref:D-glycero-beta-D-manno-heptose 1-phosphate adenylyltransferase n=1 Tax=Desertivirga brevis TaxID=2810310 RepID=UPI001A95C523|nr:D-glycero-beta-D-manno-heptose 1-phosphate adenylyltransferase [Pedobacter sp. SYSU D00873]